MGSTENAGVLGEVVAERVSEAERPYVRLPRAELRRFVPEVGTDELRSVNKQAALELVIS